MTSYGLQKHRSEILVLRSGLGVGMQLNEKLSIGGGLGLIYNENRLDAPYIFQTQPTLKGFKTLLDLETSGFGWNGNLGILFRPITNLQFGVIYKSGTTVHSKGDASGNAQAQLTSLGGGFAGARPDFHYDAEVVNHFPQIVAAGLSWQPHARWRFSGQVDWVNWSDAFDRLPVKLSNGNNADFNALLGSDSAKDYVPLSWRDQIVYRVGAEFAVTEKFRLRGGYSYAKSPVPDKTLTPLTAVITEHTVTTGFGYEQGRYKFDLAYQWDLPAEQRVGNSGLRAGEYSNSATKIGIHWVGITTGVRF